MERDDLRHWDPRPPLLRLDRRIIAQVALRLMPALAFLAAESVESLTGPYTLAGALVAVRWTVYGVVDWVRTADWEHDRRVTAEGHRTAPARRQEARRTSAFIREQKRLVRARRRAGRS